MEVGDRVGVGLKEDQLAVGVVLEVIEFIDLGEGDKTTSFLQN